MGEEARGAAALTMVDRVLAELLAARKTQDGLSPVGIAACSTITALLGDGDPLVAFTCLQTRILEVLDTGDDVMPIEAASYSLGLASRGKTHLDRLNEFGAEYGYEARQARRHSDRGIRRLASLICSNWIVQTAPVCGILVTQNCDKTFALDIQLRRQWFVDMHTPEVRRICKDGSLGTFVPAPIFTNSGPSPPKDPADVWITSKLERPLHFPEPKPGEDMRVRVAWVGEVWPVFETIVRELFTRAAITISTIGNSCVVRFGCD